MLFCMLIVTSSINNTLAIGNSFIQRKQLLTQSPSTISMTTNQPLNNKQNKLPTLTQPVNNTQNTTQPVNNTQNTTQPVNNTQNTTQPVNNTQNTTQPTRTLTHRFEAHLHHFGPILRH